MRIKPINTPHTYRLVPKYGASRREAPNSTPSDAMPETNTSGRSIRRAVGGVKAPKRLTTPRRVAQQPTCACARPWAPAAARGPRHTDRQEVRLLDRAGPDRGGGSSCHFASRVEL